MSSSFRSWWPLGLLFSCTACSDWPSFEQAGSGPLAKTELTRLTLGQRVPNEPEANAVGAVTQPLARGSRGFSQLVECAACPIAFKNEERNHSDRMMTPRLRRSLLRLSRLVARTWPDTQLRVTEAWDGEREHGQQSAHYEGRAADITTADQDPKKLGRLGALAVSAELDWVYFEDATHVHVSVKK